MRTALLLLAALAMSQTCSAQPAADDAALYKALLSGGHVGLMRHSTAPGSDDPPNFRLGDCSTQRNLSDGGRSQATAIGTRLRANGISRARVVSSQWCRTLETARLLAVGEVEEQPALNSLVSYPGQSAAMTREARDWILKQDLATPTILVTHQVNIGALVGSSPGEGDIVVVQRAPSGELRVIGTIAAN